MDYYLDSNNVYDRLLQEYLQHGRLIICVDDRAGLAETYDILLRLLNEIEVRKETGNG